MKWISISLLVIWLCLIGLAMYWAWQSFDNMQTISGGGYLYDDTGEVIELWDRWEKANYPDWMFGVAAPIIIVTEMPLWWMMIFWPITAYFAFWIYANRPCISLR